MFKTPVRDPFIQTELLNACAELATAILRNKLLRYYEIVLTKKEPPRTPMVTKIEQHTTEWRVEGEPKAAPVP